MKTTRWLSLALVLLLTLGMVACGTSSTPAAATTEAPKVDATQAPAVESTEPGAAKDYSKAIEVSMNVMDAEMSGNNAKSDFIKEKLNLTFKYIPVTWGDWNEKVRTWIATDDAPDLIWWDLKGGSSNEYRSWADQGAFKAIPQDKLFNPARPDLEALANKMKDTSIKALTVNGELYAWPSYRNNPDAAQSTYDSNFGYRRDWAKAVGKYQPDDIYTWDQWTDMIKTVISEDPGKNGPGNTQGIVMPPWAYPHAAVLFIHGPEAEGNETCSYIVRDGKYVWPPALDDYKAGVKLTWQLYQDGLIWKDNIQAKSNENEQQFKSGLAVANYGVGASTYNTWTDEMLKGGQITEREAFGQAFVLDPEGNYWMTQTEDYWTVTAFGNKVDDEKMDRVLDFWDYCNSVEGIRLRWLGIEGVDYEVIGEGVSDVKVLWEIDPATNNFFSPYTDTRFNESTPASLAPPGNPADMAFGWDEVYRRWDYMASGKLPLQLKKFDYAMSFSSFENKDKYGNYGMDVKAKLSELIVSSKDIDADWDAFIQTMMPRVQPILDELNAGLLAK